MRSQVSVLGQSEPGVVWDLFVEYLGLYELVCLYTFIYLQPEVDVVNREACERFAAGYIQCMHEVHTFVSSCPGIDPTVAAELLNHLLESMPLHDEDRLRLMLPDSGAELPCCISSWPLSEALASPAPSSCSTDELGSDLDDTASEQSHVSAAEEAESQDGLSSQSLTYSKSMWRPW